MGVELDAGGRAFFWKIAYDETLAGYSPGVLLTRALSRRLLAESRMNLVDSCAAPDHPMIDRLWPDRLEFTDIALASPGGGRTDVRCKPRDGAGGAEAPGFRQKNNISAAGTQAQLRQL